MLWYARDSSVKLIAVLNRRPDREQRRKGTSGLRGDERGEEQRPGGPAGAACAPARPLVLGLFAACGSTDPSPHAGQGIWVLTAIAGETLPSVSLNAGTTVGGAALRLFPFDGYLAICPGDTDHPLQYDLDDSDTDPTTPIPVPICP